MAAKLNALVLGGGIAGLETSFLLKHRLHDKVDVTLVSDKPDFLYRPDTVYLAFGGSEAGLRIPLTEPALRQDINLVEGRAMGVDPAAHSVTLEDGRTIAYDRLVIATGASIRPEEIPGLAEFANTIWTPKDMRKLRTTFHRVVDRAQVGRTTRVLFLIPPNNKCAGPLYEMVFMFESYLRKKKAREMVEILWATSESAYFEVFGPRIHEVVEAEFSERHIYGYRSHIVSEVTRERARFDNGTEMAFDELVTFPPYVAAVTYPGLPADDRGFLTTELHSRNVLGVDGVFAPGDAGDFPVKQSFLAFLQADAVAEDLVAELRGTHSRAPFNPVSMCLMEQFDKATFAQVPLMLTGDPASPVGVRPDAGEEYKVGVSPMWRLGKKMLGAYIPMRFRAGEPFHAGKAWHMLEAGLKGMSSVLAE